jgi:PAS domain S-box-containing protein
MAFLRATKGLETGSVCELKPGVNTLGRDARRCDVVLRHHAVSREHARIDVLPDGVFVEDLESRNGVQVNGEPLLAGMSGRKRLASQDRIGIAGFEFVFHEEAAETVANLHEESTESHILSTVDVLSDSAMSVLKRAASSERVAQAARSTTNSRSTGSWSDTADMASAYRKLSSVLTIIEQTSCQVDQHAVPARILDCLFSVFPQTESGCLLLPDPAGHFFVAAMKNSDGSATAPRISRGVLDYVARNKQAVLSGEIGEDSAFSLSQSAMRLRVRSVMCVPLIDSSSRVVAIIDLDTSRTRGEYTKDDLQILAGVARHLAILIENAGLHAAALQAQRAEFETRFRQLIEVSIHGVLIHRDFEPLFVNEAWARLHGYAPEEVLDMESVLPLLSLVSQDRAVATAKDLMAGTRQSWRGERQDLLRAGQPFWVEEHATLIDWDGGPAIQSTIVDLSDRKQTEKRLRDARDDLEIRVADRTRELADAAALYRSLVNHIPLCVLRKSVDGEITFVNRALCELFGRRADEFIGKTDYDLFSKEQAAKYRAADERVMETGQQVDLVESLPLPAGEVRQIQTLKTPAYDADGALVGIQLIFWDITEQKKTEEERNRYAAELERSNRDLEQFAYSVSHDLQSPLRTVASYCQMLQREHGTGLKDEAREYLGNAIEGTRRMRRLLDDLLAYSKVSTSPREFESVKLEQVLNEALRNLAAAIRDNGAVVTHDPLPTVFGNQTQLMQLLQNLVSNALAHRRGVAPRIHVGTDDDSTCWRVSVSDNGEGIDSKDFGRVFQLFQRLCTEQERPGTGIGLSLCKRIVEHHGGRIGVESKKGEGSTFFFTLPKQPDASHSAPAMDL